MEAGSAYLITSSESDAELHNLAVKIARRWVSRKMLKKRELLVSLTTAEFPSNAMTRLVTHSTSLALNRMYKWTAGGETGEAGARQQGCLVSLHPGAELYLSG